MKLILSSCDFGHPASAEFIRENLGLPMERCRVLFFPNEKSSPGRIASGKYHDRLTAFGFDRDNVLAADYSSALPDGWHQADAVYISGGNTFGTMKLIRQAGFDRAILSLVRSGAIYIGGSAGAHIASADIGHTAAYDRDDFGLTDQSGLGLYPGILICHYTDGRKEDLERLTAEGRFPVRALADGESILINR